MKRADNLPTTRRSSPHTPTLWHPAPNATANCLLGATPKGKKQMKSTQLLHNLGQSIWLDNITRDLLNSGTLKRYISELSVTGLTSNPTIFDHAIKNSTAYDSAIRDNLGKGIAGEDLFFNLALE